MKDTDEDEDVAVEVEEDKNTILEHHQQHSKDNIERENSCGITEVGEQTFAQTQLQYCTH